MKILLIEDDADRREHLREQIMLGNQAATVSFVSCLMREHPPVGRESFEAVCVELPTEVGADLLLKQCQDLLRKMSVIARGKEERARSGVTAYEAVSGV